MTQKNPRKDNRKRVAEMTEEELAIQRTKRREWYYSRSPEYKAELLRKQREYTARKKAERLAKNEQVRRAYSITAEQQRIHSMQNAVNKAKRIAAKKAELEAQGLVGYRVCTVCAKAKPVSDFLGANGRRICKICIPCRTRIYNTTRPEKGQLSDAFWVMKARRINDFVLKKQQKAEPDKTLFDMEQRILVEDLLACYNDQQGVCYYCGDVLDTTLHVDHKQPLSRGGSNTRDNICLSCSCCNRMKWTQTEEEFKATLSRLASRMCDRAEDKEPQDNTKG